MTTDDDAAHEPRPGPDAEPSAAGVPSEPVPFGTRPGPALPPPAPEPTLPTAPAPYASSARARGRRRAAVLAVVASAAALGLVLWGVRPAPVPLAAVAPSPSLPSPTVPALPTGPASPSSSPGRPASAGPVEGFEETDRPAGLPLGDLTQRTGAGYVFSSRQKDKRTGVAWSPCRPLHYVVRGAGSAPREGGRMLREAFARIAALTGLEIVDDGTTTERYDDDRRAYQPRRYGQRWAPVLVSWSTTRQDPGLKGDVLGRAGAQWVVTGSGDRAYVTGTVSLDAAEIGRLRSRSGYTVARAVVLHELAHLIGLGHVQDRSSLLYPRVRPTVTDFSARDRAGLRVLGQGPCQPDV